MIFSKILLFREYQSRLYAWKVKLQFDGNDFFNKKKSYHNLFLDLSPSWINSLKSEEDIENGRTYSHEEVKEKVALWKKR